MAAVLLVLLCGACTDSPREPAPRIQQTGPVEVPNDLAAVTPPDVSPPAGAATTTPSTAAALSPTAAAACGRLVAALPDQLGGGELARRPVITTGAGTTARTTPRAAAWGDPPIRLVCGVPPPERLSEPVQLGPLDRTELVTFNVRDIGAGYLYTTVGRAVNVSVEVPDAYDVPYLQPLTAPILDTLPAAR